MWLAGKLIGSVCIAVSFWMIGNELEHRLRLRWKLLAETKELLVWLEKEMTYHRTIAEEALKEAAGHCTTMLGTILYTTAEQLKLREGVAFQVIWEQALAQWIPGGFLEKEQMEVLQALSGALCCSDTVMQRTMLQKYTQRLEQMALEEAENCAQKGRLYRRLATAAGAFVIIMLL